MANIGFLATVCVLAVLAGHVNCQCPVAQGCFSDLGINITAIGPTTGLDGVINKICQESAKVLHCYDLLLNCALIAPAKTVIPTHSGMQDALQTICQNQTEVANGFTCLALQPAYPAQVSACSVQLTHSVTGMTPAQQANEKALYCSVMDLFFNCLTSMSSMQKCGSDFKNTLLVFGKHLLPADCPSLSGSPRLNSWPFLGVIAALIASSLKRL